MPAGGEGAVPAEVVAGVGVVLEVGETLKAGCVVSALDKKKNLDSNIVIVWLYTTTIIDYFKKINRLVIFIN